MSWNAVRLLWSSFCSVCQLTSSARLAYCELYICLAALILRVFPRAELYKTEDSDIAYDHDEFVGRPKCGSKGLRLLIRD